MCRYAWLMCMDNYNSSLTINPHQKGDSMIPRDDWKKIKNDSTVIGIATNTCRKPMILRNVRQWYLLPSLQHIVTIASAVVHTKLD